MTIARPRVLLVTWGCDPEDVSEPQVAARWCRELLDRELAHQIISVSKPSRHGIVREAFGPAVFAELKDLPSRGPMERIGAIAKPGTLVLAGRLRATVERCIEKERINLVHQLNPFGWRFGTPLRKLQVPLVRGPVGGGVRTPHWHLASASRKEKTFEFARRMDEERCRRSSRLRSSMGAITELLVAAEYLRGIPALQSAPSISVESEHGVQSAEVPPIEAMPRARSRGESLRLFFAGRLVRSKGPLLAIEAASKLPPDVDWKLDLAGTGPLQDEIGARIRELGVADRVNMLGWVTHAEVLERMRNSHVFLFPSYREPSGGVVVEAFAQGLPVITANAGGPGTLVDDTTGFRVSIESREQMIKEIAKAIGNLYEREANRMEMGKAALDKCRSVFSWDRKAERIAHIYNRALQPMPTQNSAD